MMPRIYRFHAHTGKKACEICEARQGKVCGVYVTYVRGRRQGPGRKSVCGEQERRRSEWKSVCEG